MPEDKTKSSLKKKIELKAISEWVSRGESVLDLGCEKFSPKNIESCAGIGNGVGLGN